MKEKPLGQLEHTLFRYISTVETGLSHVMEQGGLLYMKSSHAVQQKIQQSSLSFFSDEYGHCTVSSQSGKSRPS